ncbi:MULTISPECIES: AsmA family protein [Rhodomicrobium]|uniref:AsmA family protein n=1 Tax=Rhodomicrobium TaxID=1068 RepID=UPI000B4B3E4B|nr:MULTISPECIES: AsmA family protein [Rhodomicrobium]
MRLKVPFFGYLLALIGLFLPSVIFVAILPSLINAEPVKARLLAELNDWAGARVTIGGPVSIESFFSLSVNLQDVEIASFKGLPNIKLFKAERVMARIAWTNLLTGTLDFDKIKIYNAQADAVGFGTDDLPDALRSLLTAQYRNPFDAFSLTNCRITFIDAPDASRRDLLIAGIGVYTRKSDAMITADGVFAWNGERVHGRLVTSAVAPDAGDAAVPIRLDVTSRLLSASFHGQAQLGPSRTASGDVNGNTPDAAELAKWIGVNGAPQLQKAVGIAGKLDFSGATLSLQTAALSLGAEKASGDLTLTLEDAAGTARRLEGSLAFEALDLRPIWQAGFAEPSPASPPESPAESLAKSIDMDLGISARSVRWDALASGSAAFTVTRKARLVSVEIAELGLFEGSMLGHVELDLSRPRAMARARLTAENVEAAQLLQALSQRDWLDGRADANIEAQAEGGSPDELLSSATGSARLGFPDGGQIRLDIPQLARSAGADGVDGWTGLDFARSDFDEMRAQLSLQSGQIRCSELSLSNRNSVVRGNGEVDLARQSLDWKFTVSPNAGDDAAADAPRQQTGAESSLSIKGPWLRPAIRSSERSSRAGGNGSTTWGMVKNLLAVQ